MGRIGSLAMLILFLLFVQDLQVMDPEPITAEVFLGKGDRVELVNVEIIGFNTYTFELTTNGETSFVSLFRVSRITKKDHGAFEVLFDDGTVKVGRINTFTFGGRMVTHPDKETRYTINQVERVQFIAGSQLRSCFKGHYEKYTPYPYCPVCGDLLAIGPYLEDQENRAPTLPPLHKLRVDPRNQ